MKTKIFFLIVAIACFCQVSYAQTTGFSYQGSLKNAGAPASGNHDFEFRLWDAASGGAQVGSTVTLNGVAVTNGVFAVTLDFGDQYPNASRFLEVRVRPTGGGAFTTLTPREQIKAVPYAVKSLNTEQLGGVAASQYVTTTTGGANFIQNTTTPQASSNFNISGNGIVAGRIGIGTQSPSYRLHVEHQGPLGGGEGILNKSTSGYSVLDIDAANGDSALRFAHAGVRKWGVRNQPGTNNFQVIDLSVLEGEQLRIESITGKVVIGGGASTSAKLTVTGGTNVSGNLDIGGNLTNITGNGIIGGNLGIGTSAPGYKLHVVGENVRVQGNTSGTLPRFSLNFTGGGVNAKKWQNYATTNALVFSALNDNEDSESIWMEVNRGAGAAISSVQFRSSVVVINNLGAAGATALCRNAASEISTCSSSLRYKNNIGRFSQGMSFINQLRPISFDWKDGGLKDIGFGAEDIAKIDPRFVTYNSAGEVEGVKYDRLSVAFVNAFKEQQAEISSQQSAISEMQAVSSEQTKKINDQQKQIDALKKLVCALKPDAEVCTEK